MSYNAVAANAQALEQSRGDQSAFAKRIVELAAIARDSTQNREARYLAVMRITAAYWKRRKSRDFFVPDRPPPSEKRMRNRPTAPEKNLVKLSKPQTGTIAEYAERLLLQADQSGRGLPHDVIHALVLKKFPVVLTKGPHYGRPTKFSRKELHMLACGIKRGGVAMPPRPRATNRRAIRGRMMATERADAIAAQSDGTFQCIVCDRLFVPAVRIRKPPRYCSAACRQAAHRQRRASWN